MKWILVMLPVLALAACGKDAALDAPVEVVKESAVALRVSATGEVRSAKATPLAVPGQGWSQRQLEWMLPEGAQVKQGEASLWWQMRFENSPTAPKMPPLKLHAPLPAFKTVSVRSEPVPTPAHNW